MTTGASCQELCQLRVSSYEPVSLLTAVAAVEADRDGATGPTEHPPQAPSVFPAAQQGDEIRAVLHTTCIPRGAAPTVGARPPDLADRRRGAPRNPLTNLRTDLLPIKKAVRVAEISR